MKNKKPGLLFLLHIPPPVHGSSMVGQWIKNSTTVSTHFQCSYINLLASRSTTETGKIGIRKIIEFAGTIIRLLFSIIGNRPQLCYLALTTTGAAFFRDLILVAILKTFRIEIVYHLHNKGIREASTSRINRICYHFVFKNGSIITLSDQLRSDIELVSKCSDIYTCPNGTPSIAGRQNNNPSATILFLSNLIESKGVLILLSALQVLKERNREFNAILVGGEGDIKIPELESRIAKSGLTAKVQYVGKKYGNDKEDILSNTTIFAFPTFYPKECFPLVLLEAMQHSLPVVSTFEGGIPDIVDDGVTGFLVPQKDAEALADKLEILINNPELRKQMGEAGLKKYEEQFTLEKFENRLVEILEDILEKQNK